MLTQAGPEIDPAETAFELLDRLNAAPEAPRFALIGGLRMEFPARCVEEADNRAAGLRVRRIDDLCAVTIDDEETLEIDDAMSCEPTSGGGLRVRIYIALVADLVAKGTDRTEAAARAATAYLPETTVRMLPEEISCRRASLRSARSGPTVLVTEVTALRRTGELMAIVDLSGER